VVTPRTDAPASERPIERSLALATFDSAWGRIEHTHYDTTFRGVDWQGVRTELRPRAAEAATHEALRAVLSDMVGRLGESHYSVIPGEMASTVSSGERGEGGRGGDLGFELRVAEGAVVVSRMDAGGPGAAAGIRLGWVVDSIDGRPLVDELGQLAELEGTPGHRLALTQFLWSVTAALEGAPGSTVRISAQGSEGQSQMLQLTRRTRPGQPVDFGNLPTLVADLDYTLIPAGERCVGVIRFNIWMTPIAGPFDQAVDAVRGCDGIVIDLRGNPGGVAGMVMGVAGHFMKERKPLGVLKTRTGELRLVANPRTVNTTGQVVEPYGGPLALLIDPLTVSTSEIFAAGLQSAGRARVFGQTSAGQALPAMAVRLPNGDVLMHVVADLTAPDGRRVEGQGVVPDVTVPLTRTDLLAGRDAVLEAALNWILTPSAGPGEPATTQREESH
jgi:carboxyl-terminal processing protease